jgi:hypothetical protein
MNKSSSWGFGTEQRPSVAPKHLLKNPSPTGYSLPSKMVEGPKIQMHSKTISVDMAVKNNYPSGGHYEIQHRDNMNFRSGSKFSMGKEQREAVNFHAKE